MFLGLKRNRKVQPAKAQKGVYDYKNAMLPKEYLFWGERDVFVKEDGFETWFVERECFLGNTDENRLSHGDNGNAFAMKKLTGEMENELFFPEVRGTEIVVRVPHGQDFVDYEIAIDGFVLGDKNQDAYRLGDIIDFAKEQNEKRRQSAINIEQARKASVMQ